MLQHPLWDSLLFSLCLVTPKAVQGLQFPVLLLSPKHLQLLSSKYWWRKQTVVSALGLLFQLLAL